MRFISTLAVACCVLTPTFAQETTPVAPEVAPETTVPQVAPDAVAPETVAPQSDEAIEAAKYELRWRPNVGEMRVMRLTAEQNVSAGPGQNLTQKVEQDYAMQVLALGEDGSFTVRTTFRAVRFNRVAPGIKQAFDSAKPGKNLSEEFKIFQAMVGAQVTMRFSSRGTIVEVSGVDNFYDRIFSVMGVKKADRATMAKIAQSGTGGQTFRNIGNTIASFPPEFVTLGQTWPKIDPVMTDDNLIYDGVCTLESVNGRTGRIAITSQIKPDASRPAPNASAAKPVSGTQTGYYDINLDSGWTTGALLTQSLKAKLLASGQMVGPETKGAGTPFELLSTFKLRTLGVKRAPQ